MQRINLYDFYQLGATLHRLSETKWSRPLDEGYYGFRRAITLLTGLLENHLVPLIVCRPAAKELLDALRGLVPDEMAPKQEELAKEMQFLNVLQVIEALKVFENVLSAELQSLDSYFIAQKGIYSTSDLIDHAEKALDEATRATISAEAIDDFGQAGRCLALELPTAAGFHIMRSAEAVLRQWHCQKVGKKSRAEWATCVNELRKASADTNTLAVVDQIRDLHRNPLMHPEIFLTVAEALRLFDIGKSAIVAMAEQIKKVATASPASS